MFFIYRFFEWLRSEPKAAAPVQHHPIHIIPLPTRTQNKIESEENQRLREKIRLYNLRLKTQYKKPSQ